jgi:capsular exopolysaccharide synthesis family protein
MRNIPLHGQPKRKPHEARPGKPAAGPAPWSTSAPAPARSLVRRLLILLASLGVGLALAGAVIAALPTRYVAETRILQTDASDLQNAAANRSPGLADQVIGELHLDRDADFIKAPWQPPQAVLGAIAWAERQTGRKMLFLPDSAPQNAGDGSTLVDRFWDRIEIGHLGRSSRVLTVRAWSGDPQQAAAIANLLGRLVIGNGTLIAQALPPTESGYPPVETILIAGAAAGVLLGLAGIVLVDSKPRQFSRAEEIESASGLPVLAVVPQLDDGGAAIANVLRDPGSPYADSLRKLYEKLHSQRGAPAPKVIAISSALPGEGRSTLAASLGRLLASEGGRVLLIDCDWRHPELHTLFRLSNDTGLTSLLIDPHIALDDVIHTDALSGLDIITAGRRNRQAVHKLISEPMEKILATLATGYDLVLLDMPPVLAADESLLLSGLVDKLIFAVRWHHTLRSRATEGMDKILAARGDVLGVVFTRVDLPRYRKAELSLATTK